MKRILENVIYELKLHLPLILVFAVIFSLVWALAQPTPEQQALERIARAIETLAKAEKR